GANPSINTPYVNTITPNEEPAYPGDLEIEHTLESILRWNAMAMVVKANRLNDGLGGHISSYASSAVLYEVGQNHFFKANGKGRNADQIYFQGHTSPGNYSRAYLEGRLEASHLHNFRQELAEDGGLSSYPHPYLMPEFWQFPTVSMGLGPIMSIYQARFNRYLTARGILEKDESKVWCFVGDGECDEPETLGALRIASREKLDNLIFVINCNLQRLDGPVFGNGSIVQELESVFKGAGWNVVKLIWGTNWDPLLQSDHGELLLKRMSEAVDGEWQKYTVEPGSYMRKNFFGKYPELLELVSHLSDDQLKELTRGGHDPKKVYAAYDHATKHKGSPTVILAKTVKGYGLGEAGEGKNISHQQKKLNEKELREYRNFLNIPINDEDIVDTPFYRPPSESKEMKYLLEKRKDLGGYLPVRHTEANTLELPESSFYDEFLNDGGKSEISTTMAFVRVFNKLLRDKNIAKYIVPIIPDEARTFGMEALFRQIGIYSSRGQLYEPADSESLSYYKEAKDGQILEEGINEAGAMASFLAAGTAYSTHAVNMIPFYVYYSMFGFQRVGDMMWLAGDIGAKGFLMGGTAGRTTLNGEGLQHQDGHSHLIASTIPKVQAYDVAFRYEIALVIQDGMRRMYGDNEEVFYYITIGNENYKHPEMPKGAEQGIINGLYRFSKGNAKKKHKAHLFGSGSIMNEVIKAAEMLENYDVSADVWGATNYKRLREESIETRRWNRLHPTKKRKQSYLEETLAKEKGVFLAASDNMRTVSDQIAPWVPGGLTSLGCDGFGRSETRENLRRFYEVDAPSIVVATLFELSEAGSIPAKTVEKAIKDLGLNPDAPFSLRS
ncbi:pyruvate dehydrogenase (acetyl-transferring), homodimeric type, partial [bacterium]|nr:pyruvate dehydrogenase (acetyl-transferring), homodimeric type [bacterium]